jgi:hypothetical protein
MYDAHGKIQLRIITFRSMAVTVKGAAGEGDGPYRTVVAARIERAPDSRCVYVSGCHGWAWLDAFLPLT